MRKTKYLVFGVGVLIACVFSLMFSRPAQAADESLTLETYYPAPYGAYAELTTTSNTYLATEGGNVGIGTTGSSELLHLKSSTSGKTILRLDDSLGVHKFIIKAGQTGLINPAIGTQSSESWELIANDSPVMFIANTGNVGIGTTSPAQRLEINNGSLLLGRNTGNYIASIGVSDPTGQVNGGGRAVIEFENSSLDQSIHFVTHQQAVSSGRRMSIDRGGNVGIGTTSPLSKLDIRGRNDKADGPSFENILNLASTDSIDPLTLRAGIKTATNPTNRYGAIEVDDAGTKRALVLQPTGGNVGIGTTNPSTPSPENNQGNNLDVNDVYMRSTERWLSQGPRMSTIATASAVCSSGECEQIVLIQGGPYEFCALISYYGLGYDNVSTSFHDSWKCEVTIDSSGKGILTAWASGGVNPTKATCKAQCIDF